MITMLNNWKGSVEINGITYDNIREANLNNLTGPIHIILNTDKETRQNHGGNNIRKDINEDTQYKIKVRQYMTRKSSAEFDFMKKWNNDVPMPMRVMVGKKLEETRGMVKMELHGDILQEITPCCMCCGRKITNKVSQYFGMGPECGNHGYVNPFDSEEELKEAVNSYKKKLQSIKWTGWIIKSAIEEEEIV